MCQSRVCQPGSVLQQGQNSGNPNFLGAAGPRARAGRAFRARRWHRAPCAALCSAPASQPARGSAREAPGEPCQGERTRAPGRGRGGAAGNGAHAGAKRERPGVPASPPRGVGARLETHALGPAPNSPGVGGRDTASLGGTRSEGSDTLGSPGGGGRVWLVSRGTPSAPREGCVSLGAHPAREWDKGGVAGQDLGTARWSPWELGADQNESRSWGAAPGLPGLRERRIGGTTT